MGRTVAVVWHASFSVMAAILFFFFVLPRWWELTDAIPHVLGTVLRIVTAVLIALAALPVVFTLLRVRKPEYGTPQLALTLLLWSIVAHVLAGVLITGTTISELWLSLDRAGQWLFAIYGAAAAIALLGIGSFYLSVVAELPPPPPKPLKPKKQKQSRRSRKKDTGSEETAEAELTETETVATEAEADADAVEAEADAPTVVEQEESTVVESDAPSQELVSTGGRRKRRPIGKRRSKNGD